MGRMLISSPEILTVADLLDRLGGIPADRVRYFPLPGTATEQDVIEIDERENRHFELVDGTLVEKMMGFWESMVAMMIGRLLGNFVVPRKLGIIAGPDAMLRLFPDNNLVRMPDVSYFSADRLPPPGSPRQAVERFAPNLAVEVLSPGNTTKEMDRKWKEYFDAGVQIVWIVDVSARTVAVYVSADAVILKGESDFLDGGDVLPGLTISVAEVFAQVPR